MKFIGVILFSVLVLSCKQGADQPVASDDLEVYDYIGLEPLLNKSDDKTYVVNFWATWCAPCIKELPYFERINRDYSEKNVEVLLISLDFPRQYEKKLKPYIKDNNLKSRVVALNDPDMNNWIPKVDDNWTGSIPATIIYNKNNRQFYEKSFTYEELVTEVRKFIEK